MEQENRETIPQEEEVQAPRPRWQVWAARIALVAFIGFLIMYYALFFRGA